MNTLSKFIKSIGVFFDLIAKARVQSTLLGMGREWVERHGYSYDLLRAGTSEWPWRAPVATAEQPLEHKVSDLELRAADEKHAGIKAAA